MLTQERPHDGFEAGSVFEQVLVARRLGTPVLPVPSTGDPVLLAIIARALQPQPSLRPTFEDIRIILEEADIINPISAFEINASPG